MSAATVDRTIAWLLRAVWASLPVTAGAAIAAALDEASTGFRTTAAVGAWVIWALTLVATLLPHTLTLTLVRVVAPASVGAAAWAVIETSASGAGVLALAVTVVAAALALAPHTAAVFVDGTSYGDERRLPLRAPLVLLVAPIPLAWTVTVAGGLTGPLLLADRRWVAGAIVTALGIPLAAITARALIGLARRWVVFVPAGLVLHDLTALSDPQLFRRVDIASLSPAPADTQARDLTQGAAGLALELRLTGETKAAIRPPRGRTARVEPTPLTGLLFSPTQPGRVLAEAARRRIAVG